MNRRCPELPELDAKNPDGAGCGKRAKWFDIGVLLRCVGAEVLQSDPSRDLHAGTFFCGL